MCPLLMHNHQRRCQAEPEPVRRQRQQHWQWQQQHWRRSVCTLTGNGGNVYAGILSDETKLALVALAASAGDGICRCTLILF